MGKPIMYCDSCGRLLRRPEGDRARCKACRAEAGSADEGRRSTTKVRTFSILRSVRSRAAEDPLTGILLNAVLVAVGAGVLFLLTPSQPRAADPRARLEATLSNIRRIRESDPAFIRAAEVLSLYDAAADLAGLRRPEVDRLREEYSRELRRIDRD